MGLFDKVKGAVAKGVDMAGKVVADIQAAQELAAKEEAEKKAAEKAAAEAEKAKKEEAERKKIEAMLKPSCEKGDCLWNNKQFYFTCPTDCECERKKYTKRDWGGELLRPDFWPYMKRLEWIEKNEKNGDAVEEQRKVQFDFVSNFLPNYSDFLRSYYGSVIDLALVNGFEKKNLLMGLLFDLHDKVTKETAHKLLHDKLLFLSSSWEATKLLGDPFFRNFSLYDRSLDDFKYAVNLFIMVMDEEKARSYYKDISMINVDSLYDGDGNVKPTGFGGPEKGFYGETLWNLVESWCGENGENEVEEPWCEENGENEVD